MVLAGKNPRNSSNPVPRLKTHENRNRFSILISVGFLGSNLVGGNSFFSLINFTYLWQILSSILDGINSFY